MKQITITAFKTNVDLQWNFETDSFNIQQGNCIFFSARYVKKSLSHEES